MRHQRTIGYRIMNPGTTEVIRDNGTVDIYQEQQQDQYYIVGVIYDSKTGIGIPSIVSLELNGKIVASSHSADDGTYDAWTDDPTHAWLIFEAPGYPIKKIGFWELYDNADIAMHKGGKIPWALIAMVITLVLIYRKHTKKVGKLSTGDVLPIMLLAGGVLGFSVIKDVLEFLGLWKDKNEKELDEAEADPNTYWNPNYWKTILPPGGVYNYPIDGNTATAWAREIYNAFGAINDCEECVIAVCKRCRTKANFSYLCDYFQRIYGQDMITFLRGGWWPQDRLSDSDVNLINNYIKGLPNY